MGKGLYYDRLKTWLLILLVAISIVLTWLLWTYQPDIAYQDSEAVEIHPIGEERSLEDVIRPNKIVKHQAGETSIIMETESIYDEIYDRLVDSDIQGINFFPPAGISNGFEIVYPDTVPIDMFLNLFSNGYEDDELETLSGVDRLLLYTDGSDTSKIQIYSGAEDSTIEIGVTFPASEFQRYFDREQSVPAITMNEPNEDDFILKQQNIYVPAEEVEVQYQEYSTERLNTLEMRDLLFPDIDTVRGYRQSNGELTYTDGTRILNLRDNENFMTYRNSSASESSLSPTTSIAQSSYDYINSQSAWTNDYILSWWRDSGDRDYAIYRLFINDLPVFNIKDSSDNMTLQFERTTDSQTMTYIRPLLILDESPIDERSVILQSGTDLLTRIQQSDRQDIEDIRDVRIGYEMTDDKDRLGLVTLEPNWYILAGNGWEKVSFSEEGNNELE